MNTTTKQILRTYKSLHLSNIPDDLINEVFCFIGDITETPTMMANKECLHLVKSKTTTPKLITDYPTPLMIPNELGGFHLGTTNCVLKVCQAFQHLHVASLQV